MRPNTVPYTRRTLTRAQAAEAAAQNVGKLGDVRVVATLAADFICDPGSATPTLPPSIRAAVRRRDEVLYAPLSSTAGSMPDGDAAAIRGYLLALASPSGNDEVLTWVVSDWLHDRLDAHGDALNDLRLTHPSLYNALFAPTLHKALRIGKRAGIDRARLQSLFADHARFLLVGAAHDRTAHVRRIATSPNAGHFSGLTQWKSAGHVLLCTVAEPALTVEQVYRCAPTFSGTDEAARKKVFGKKLLPANDAGAFVFEAALEARAIILRRKVSLDHVQATLDRTSEPLACVARITGNDIAREGFARSSMSSLWFGLEPTELTTYIAMELLKALNAVDALVKAAMDGGKVALINPAPSANEVAYTATLLRDEGKPDRESLQLGRPRGADGGLDPGNRGGRGPLASLTGKLRDPVIADAVARRFGIDANRLFQR